MGFVPDFENDIFISYAHIDNQPLTRDQEGWISQFHEALEVRLQQLLGAKVAIWRDAKLQGNDIFADTLTRQFPKIAVLVSVISPRYINSEWCRREVEEFCRAAEQKLGLRLGDKARIFKVVKTQVPRDEQPPPLESMLGYDFFHVDPATKRPWEFRPEIGTDLDKQYWTRLEDVAYDISLLLDMLKEGGHAGEAATAPAAGPAVYLAESTSDLTGERDQIRRQLLERGFTILPDQPLPFVASALQQQVGADLQRCVLSIHMIGANYGFVPEGSSQSIIELQDQLARERQQSAAFSQLLWLPPGVQPTDERQQQVIAAIREGASVQNGAELLETGLDELKSFVLDRIEQLQQQKEQIDNRQQDDITRVYLICDETDLDDTVALEDYLFEQGFEVKLPAFDGEEQEIFEAHKQNLIICDAALIYYGKSSDAWLSSKLTDLQKSAGFGRQKALQAKAVYVAAPETRIKQRYRTREAVVIKNFGDFSSKVLAPFVEKLKAH